MSEFSAFLQLGFGHISDLQAYDHLLFIITLCAVYHWDEWKKLLVLVTAFTIGHSVTLALSALAVARLPSDMVETLIPFTILITAIHNVWSKKPTGGTFSKSVSSNYIIALFFGLIHGLGFANYFRSLFGEMGGIIQPLFAFNVGLELGQLLIVILFLGFYYLLSQMVSIRQQEWNLFISGAGAGVALTLIINQIMN